jgi:hypothetical protein
MQGHYWRNGRPVGRLMNEYKLAQRAGLTGEVRNFEDWARAPAGSPHNSPPATSRGPRGGTTLDRWT